MQGTKVHLFIACIELDNFANESIKIVIKFFKKLYCLYLPHLLDSYIVKVTRRLLVMICYLLVLLRLLGLQISLENYDVKLAVVCFGDFSEELDSLFCLPLN